MVDIKKTEAQILADAETAAKSARSSFITVWQAHTAPMLTMGIGAFIIGWIAHAIL
jgi:hypothetical protein